MAEPRVDVFAARIPSVFARRHDRADVSRRPAAVDGGVPRCARRERTFYVAPVCGALMVWFTYLLGKEATGSRHRGALASCCCSASPVFLTHM